MNTPVPVVAGQPLCVDLRSRYVWGSTVCAVAAIASDTGYKKGKVSTLLHVFSLVHPFSLVITVLSFLTKLITCYSAQQFNFFTSLPDRRKRRVGQSGPVWWERPRKSGRIFWLTDTRSCARAWTVRKNNATSARFKHCWPGCKRSPVTKTNVSFGK